MVQPLNSLDKYQVIARVNQGGMADVYLAVTLGTQGFSKLMVVKVLKDSLAEDQQFVAMFGDEARLCGRLNHPNIVQTYEVGKSAGHHFIAMEYLEGQPLHRVMETLQSSAVLSPTLCLSIFCDALSGLHYAHELRGFDGAALGIVHRDITPHNVFVTYEGQTKLVDFGIAKALDSSTHTQVGLVKGKIAYMAPEQARGEPVTRSADIFSMGVLLWEMLAGRRMWEGLTDIAIVGRLVHGSIVDLRSIRPELPSALTELTMKTLSPDPRERPPTALALQRALEAIFPGLGDFDSHRQLAAHMQKYFRDERKRERELISRQLDRLAEAYDPTRPPSSSRPVPSLLPTHLGDTVHDAVTTVHGVAAVTPFAMHRTASQRAAAVAPTSATRARSLLLGGAALGAVLGLGLAIMPRAPASDPASDKPVSIVKALAPASASLASVGPKDCSSEHKPLIELSGEIQDDAELTCNNDYLLRFTTFVTPGATLSIQPGTRLFGDQDTRGTLVVQPGGQIHAAGTKERPIVFTSSAAEGRRKPGDWGGLIMLGNAPLNLIDEHGHGKRGRIEGLTLGGEYGGSDPQDSSGVLAYVRIEYSGTEIAPNNEINGLTLGGVGRGTVLHHIQVRHTTDDCFEFFGGTVDAKHLVCQAPGDDALDWDLGYQGRLQFVVAQADPRVDSGSNGLEGDNDPNGSKNQPVSAPLIYNVTLCGKNRRMYDKEHYGLLLRRGSEIRLRNAIIQGFGAALDVRDPGTRPNIAASLVHGNLVDNLAFAESSSAPRSDREHVDDDGGLDERLYLQNPGLSISQIDPQLSNCFDPHVLGAKPLYPLLAGAAIPPGDGFFDQEAQYLGAFRDRNDNWDVGAWMVWDSP